jgi:colanic acid/amylovoran biosynthesis glycosyltransferase
LKKLCVWSNYWLPISETFIEDQILAYRGWEALRFGLTQLPEGLNVRVDSAPHSHIGHEAFQRRLLGVDSAMAHQVRLLREKDISLVHSHFGSGGLVAAPIAKKLSVPHVVTFHGRDATARSSSSLIKRFVHSTRLTSLFRTSAALIAVSNYVASQLLTLGAPKSKVHVLPIGTQLPADTICLNDGEPNILFIGRLVPKKGVDHLFRALALLPDAEKETLVRVIGSGPLREQLARLANELGLNVQFLGARPRGDAYKLANRGTIFCGPSHRANDGDSEGFGMVFLEAAARGIPVVSYAHGGVQEAVQHGVTGLLAQENDVEELSRHLEKLIQDEDLRSQLGVAGQQRTYREFNINTCTRKLEHLYDELTSRR